MIQIILGFFDFLLDTLNIFIYWVFFMEGFLKEPGDIHNLSVLYSLYFRHPAETIFNHARTNYQNFINGDWYYEHER